jgi:ribosomal-protein-alanine N-acetyltransferase
MILRFWEYTDILAVSKIEEEVFSQPWSFKMLADTFLFGKFTGILAQQDSKIIGYGGFINIAGDADITKIAVLKDFQRKGYGEKILAELIKNCFSQGVNTITLEVRTSNEAAINLYRKNNFQIIALRKNYYGNEDAYVMQLKIQR